MHRTLVAVVLSLFATLGSAQCVNPAALAADAQPGVPGVMQASTPTSAPAAATPAPRGELIKAAAAGTRDEAGMRPSANSARNSSGTLGEEEESPKRGTAAMLLAALALMMGIALRRFS